MFLHKATPHWLSSDPYTYKSTETELIQNSSTLSVFGNTSKNVNLCKYSLFRNGFTRAQLDSRYPQRLDPNHYTFFRSYCQDSSFFPSIAQPNFVHRAQEPSPRIGTQSYCGKVVLSSVEENDLCILAILVKIRAFSLLSLSQTLLPDPRNLHPKLEPDRKVGRAC